MTDEDKEMNDALNGITELAAKIPPEPVAEQDKGNIAVYGDVDTNVGEQLKLKKKPIKSKEQLLEEPVLEPDIHGAIKSLGNNLFEVVPGYYFSDEAEQLNGPYPSMGAARQAQKAHAKALEK